MKIVSYYLFVFSSFVVYAFGVESIVGTSSLKVEPEDADEVEATATVGANVESVNTVDDASIIEPNESIDPPVNTITNASTLGSSVLQPPSNFDNKTLLSMLNNTSISKFTNFFLGNVPSVYQSLGNLINRNQFVMTLALSQMKSTVSHMFTTDFINLSKQLFSAYEKMSSSNKVNLESSIKELLSNNNKYTNTSLLDTLSNVSSSNSNHRLLQDDIQQFQSGLRTEKTFARQLNYYDDNNIDRDDSYGYMSGGGSYGGGLDPYTLLAALASAAFLAATAWKVVHWKTKKKRSVSEEQEFDQYNIEELLAMVWDALEKIH